MALSADRNTRRRDAELVYVPLKAAAVVYAGGIAVADSGYAKAGVKAPGLQALGRFEEAADNTGGADGAKSALVRTKGAFLFENAAGADAVTAAQRGQVCWIEDDETVAGSAGAHARSAAGIVIAVGDDGVWVDMGVRATPLRILSKSMAVDFPSIAARSSNDQDIAVPGAAVGDQVVIGLPAAVQAGLVFDARVSAAGTVKLRASNFTAAAVDAAEATYTVGVIKG